MVLFTLPFLLCSSHVSLSPPKSSCAVNSLQQRSITHLSLRDSMFTFPCVMIRQQKVCKNMARKGPLLPNEGLKSTRFLCFYPLAIKKSTWEEKKCYVINTEIPEGKVEEFDPPIHIQIRRHDSLKIIIDSSVHRNFSLSRTR